MMTGREKEENGFHQKSEIARDRKRTETGALKWKWNCTRALPLGPSVELPMGPRNV